MRPAALSAAFGFGSAWIASRTKAAARYSQTKRSSSKIARGVAAARKAATSDVSRIGNEGLGEGLAPRSAHSELVCADLYAGT